LLLRLSNSAGAADIDFLYGDPGDPVTVGDWDGDVVDTPAVIRGATYFVRNSNTGGPADTTFTYGEPDDVFRLVGHWGGPGSAQGPGTAR
jgi:hypothetical protein